VGYTAWKGRAKADQIRVGGMARRYARSLAGAPERLAHLAAGSEAWKAAGDIGAIDMLPLTLIIQAHGPGAKGLFGPLSQLSR